MNYCKACGKTVHETAPCCTHCGLVQYGVTPSALATHSHGPIWTSINGMVFGVLALVSILAPEESNREQANGEAMFAIAAAVFSSFSFPKHRRGRGIAIAALVLGVIGLLLAIGSQN